MATLAVPLILRSDTLHWDCIAELFSAIIALPRVVYYSHCLFTLPFLPFLYKTKMEGKKHIQAENVIWNWKWLFYSSEFLESIPELTEIFGYYLNFYPVVNWNLHRKKKSSRILGNER